MGNKPKIVSTTGEDALPRESRALSVGGWVIGGLFVLVGLIGLFKRGHYPPDIAMAAVLLLMGGLVLPPVTARLRRSVALLRPVWAPPAVAVAMFLVLGPTMMAAVTPHGAAKQAYIDRAIRAAEADLANHRAADADDVVRPFEDDAPSNPHLGALLAKIKAAMERENLAAPTTSSAESSKSVPIDPLADEKAGAVLVAKHFVPEAMKDPSSAKFGQVWGMGKNVACGFVNGRNSFGAYAGERRFIFALGAVEFESETRGFAKHWDTICVDKLLSAPPTGAPGRRWGSAPGHDLKQYGSATDDGLTMFVPKQAPPPLEGVPVKQQDLQYDHKRLYAVDYYIEGDAGRDMVRGALIKKYGTPIAYNENTKYYKWSWPLRRIEIVMSYETQFKRTTVTFGQNK
jgi:hypothetical protein